ncbi:hypothetical protein [Streptomyces hirsutus]|uniref:hypothetical protein n=1 Tax=Streptomyces hirsutus TaxID=35620 RepID=UPI0036771D26
MTRLLVVRTEPAEELAAHPDTMPTVAELLLTRQRTTVEEAARISVVTALWEQLQLVLDCSVPPGEVHLRPCPALPAPCP